MKTMTRLLTPAAVAFGLLVLSAGIAEADVKTRDKTQIKFEGMLGRMMGMFGGKAMKEGIVSATAVKGDRKATMDEGTGRIVDLAAEKVYTLDLKKKSYTVVSFAELRQQLKDAQERARREAEKAAKEEAGRDKPAESQSKPPDVDVDFDVKETGEKKTLAGYEARQTIMTITVRGKGQPLDESGGIVVTADIWLGPEIPAMKELAEFELRYIKAIAPETAGVSAEQMAAVVAMYPMVKQAMDRLSREKVSLRGTPLSTVTTFEAVKSKEQLAESKPSGGGGLGGMLASRMMKRDDKPRATIFTITSDTQEISTTVAPTDVDIPAGFKENK